MSTFQVKLQQSTAVFGRSGQGNLDENALHNGTSVQRTIYVMGPNKVNRKLKDGDTFTDCNYWKRFAPVSEGGSMAEADAFIHIVSDDGSVYQDGDVAASNFVKSYTKTIVDSTTFTATNNILNVLGDTGGRGVWATISTNHDLTVRVNGSSASDFVVSGGSPFTFNNGDILIEKLAFDNASGTNAALAVVVGVHSICRS